MRNRGLRLFSNSLYVKALIGEKAQCPSDGMRMQLGVSSLYADANPHYGTGKGATIYRFTSDQFPAYYTKVIHTNQGMQFMFI